MNLPESIDELISLGYRYHHSALRAEYCSRRSSFTIKPYAGRFGRGFVVLYPNYRSNNYSPCDYYVK